MRFVDVTGAAAVDRFMARPLPAPDTAWKEGSLPTVGAFITANLMIHIPVLTILSCT